MPFFVIAPWSLDHVKARLAGCDYALATQDARVSRPAGAGGKVVASTIVAEVDLNQTTTAEGAADGERVCPRNGGCRVPWCRAVQADGGRHRSIAKGGEVAHSRHAPPIRAAMPC